MEYTGSICPTCLGPLRPSFNLCKANLKKCMKMLSLLIGCEVQVSGRSFLICFTCKELIAGVLIIQDQFTKSLEKYTGTKFNKKSKTNVTAEESATDSNIPIEDDVIPIEDDVIPIEDDVIPIEDDIIPIDDDIIPIEDDINPIEDDINPIEDDINPIEDDINPIEDVESAGEEILPILTSAEQNERINILEIIEEVIITTTLENSIDNRATLNPNEENAYDQIEENFIGCPENDIDLSNSINTPTEENVPRRTVQPVQKFSESDVVNTVKECTVYMAGVLKRRCLYCTVTTSSEMESERHMNYVHGREVENWCKRCNKQTDDLNVHYIESKFCQSRCKFCDKKFVKMVKMIHHLRTHSDNYFNPPDSFTSTTEETSSQEIVVSTGNVVDLTEEDIKLAQLPHLRFRDENDIEQALDTNIEVLLMDDEDITAINPPATNNNPDQSAPAAELNPVSNSTISISDVNSTDNNNTNRINCNKRNKPIAKKRPRRKTQNQQRRQVLQHIVEEEITRCATISIDVCPVNCLYCNSYFTQRPKLVTHVIEKHAENFPNYCRYCNANVENLEEHLGHAKNCLYGCIFCDLSYRNRYVLIRHLKSHCRGAFVEDLRRKSSKKPRKENSTNDSILIGDSEEDACDTDPLKNEENIDIKMEESQFLKRVFN